MRSVTIKKQHKKSISVIVLTLILFLAILEQTGQSVLADTKEEGFPGISVITGNHPEKDPLKILEIVEDASQAQIGAYVKGQEPYIKLEGYDSLEEGLASIQGQEKRKAFAENKITGEDGTGKYMDFSSAYTTKEEGQEEIAGPLSFEEYMEKYFLTEEDDENSWNYLKLNEKETIRLKGMYQEAKDGDFTKEEDSFTPYYGGANQKTATYKENIYGFTTEDDGTGHPYTVSFSSVAANVTGISEEELSQYYDYKNGNYGLYEKVYAEVRSDQEPEADAPVYTMEKTETGEFPNHLYENTLYTYGEVKKYAALENNQGFYVDNLGNYYREITDDTGKTKSVKLYFVSSYQMVAPEDVNIEYEGDYYYAVTDADVTFSCREANENDSVENQERGYVYEGNYSAIHPVREDAYIEAGSMDATYIISDPVYTYTPGEGNYTFAESVDGEETELTIDHIYWKGGISNNDWMKKDVFYLEEEEYDDFAIQVDVMTADELSKADNEESGDVLRAYDAICIEGGELSTEIQNQIINLAADKVACILNWDSISQKTETGVYNLAQTLKRDITDADNHFVKENIYFFSSADASGFLVNDSFDTELEEANLEGFHEITAYIDSENTLRQLNGEESMLSSDISEARAIEYIFNVPYKRTMETKSTIHVLEVEPSGNYSLTEDKILEWLGKGTETGVEIEIPDTIEITQMSSNELAGNIDDLNVTFDCIYFGLNIADYQVTDGEGNTKYADSALNGLVYMHVGDMFQLKYGTVNRTKFFNNDVDLQYRISGNDITKAKYNDLLEFVNSGYPVIVEDEFFSGKEKEKVNEEKIDNSSWMYQFVNESKDKMNLLTSTNVSDPTLFAYYLNLSKPEFSQFEGPADALEGNYITEETNGKAYMDYTFRISDEAAVSLSDTSYDVSLYVDMNSDGKYSKTTEKLEDIIVTDGNGKTIKANKDGTYSLKKNIQYDLRRQVPEGFKSLIPWKLEIIQNQNRNIRTSQIGYTAVNVAEEEKAQIKVLQIINPDATTTFYCDGRKGYEDFAKLLDAVPGLAITVEVKTTKEVKDWPYSSDDSKCFKAYDMVILGFSDSHMGLIDGCRAIQSLKEYIENGYAVLMTHDTTSHTNNDFTSKIRDMIGMDRFGVTCNELSSVLNGTSIVKSENQDAWNALESSGKDIAYAAGRNRQETYPQTQGMSIQGFARRMLLKNSSDYQYLPIGSFLRPYSNKSNDFVAVKKATQTNEGQITLYPYKINTESIDIAQTHQQYLELDLDRDKDGDGESDLVVWYTLDGAEAYTVYGKDIRNNYYIYTNGNVTYSGVGHSKGITEQEQKLFVNTIVAAYRASVHDPDVSIIEDNDVSSKEITTQFLPMDESLSLESENGQTLDSSIDIYYKVNDSNFTRTDLNLTVSYYIASSKTEENAVLLPGKANAYGIPVNADNQKTFYYNGDEMEAEKKEGEDALTYSVSSGQSYCLKLSGLKDYIKDKNSFKVYVVVSTGTFNYYGEEITRSARTEVTIRKQQLFELD
ncbi:MAG: DUF5057 domain-containing protein [Lachnospiraceae bacterium]|nr:DUF5057 domain-containing protein [Lachnospiraceae bacterium]